MLKKVCVVGLLIGAMQSASAVSFSTTNTSPRSTDRQQRPTRPVGPCYFLHQEDVNGKPIHHEPVCRAMLTNLNAFCARAEMASGLEVAPAFKHQFRLPKWTSIKPDPYLAERILRGRWKENAELDRVNWWNAKTAFYQSVNEGRLSLGRANLDLYNEGRIRRIYRVDLGSSTRSDIHLDEPVELARVNVLLAPEEFAKTGRLYANQPEAFGEVFIFDQSVYSYDVFDPEKTAAGGMISRATSTVQFGERHVRKEVICTFDYSPSS